MLELVRCQKDWEITKKTEKERYFSAAEMLTWKKKHRKPNGKYIEALRVSISI